MEGSLACSRSEPWNVYLIFVPCVFIGISDLFLNFLAGQSGVNPLKHLKTSMQSLQISMDLTDNLFSSVRTGVMRSNFCRQVIILAVKLWTFCNLLIFNFVILDQMDEQKLSLLKTSAVITFKLQGVSVQKMFCPIKLT